MPSRAIPHFPTNLLDFNSVKELPDTHAWAPLHRLDHHSPDDDVCNSETVPFIDLNDENAIHLIGQACKSWGVFQVVNHNIPKVLLDEIELAGNRLFSLPLHQKLRAARSPDGVAGYGMARISSFFSKLMWSEGFTIDDSPLEQARVLWPNDYSGFCDTIEAYKKAMKELADRLMWLMLGSIGLTKDDIKWATGGSAALQLNSYPSCPDPDRAMGLAAHTDSTILTILHQTNTCIGLQVRREVPASAPEPEKWVSVEPRPGVLVVHVGDLMHIVTNGAYPSVVHRAVVNRERRRLSVAYLYGPAAGVKVCPAGKLVNAEYPALYRPITWREYLGTKAKHFDKALTRVMVQCAPRDGFVDTNDCNKSVHVE